MANLIPSTPLHPYHWYYFEANSWIVCISMEQLIEEATFSLKPALILLFPAARNCDPWDSLAFYFYISSSTNHVLSGIIGLFIPPIFPIEPSVPWRQDLGLIHPAFNKCLLNERRNVQRWATMTKIQIRIKIDTHPALGIKETDISSP